jgi:tetratricopeptide (TPR) repeat protein
MSRLAPSAPLLAAAILMAASVLAPKSVEADVTDYWPQCSARQAEQLIGEADPSKPEQLTTAANCCAAAVLRGHGDLALARKGRLVASKAVKLRPNNAPSQYVLAVLIGLVTQNDPIYDQLTDGLKMIPEIQKHAAAAAELDPQLNYGGPDRLLGELYSQAPPQPLSIGDTQTAIQHFQKAVEAAPDFPDNRLELAQAFLKNRQKIHACAQLNAIMDLDSTARNRRPSTIEKVKKLKRRYCKGAARFQ